MQWFSRVSIASLHCVTSISHLLSLLLVTATGRPIVETSMHALYTRASGLYIQPLTGGFLKSHPKWVATPIHVLAIQASTGVHGQW